MRIHTTEQLLTLLDDVVANSQGGDRTSPTAAGFWREILTRDEHPLATDDPDENLFDWHARGLLGDLDGATVLDIGCGRGRNTRWFAGQGARVLGIDIAAGLLAEVRPSLPAGAEMTVCDVIRDELPQDEFDLVYDSGCFHHLAPHRRATYLDRVLPLVRPGGSYALVAFAEDAVEPRTDAVVLMSGDVGGGIGYSANEIQEIFSDLEMIEVRRSREGVDGGFGRSFLNASLLRRAV